ncbi:S-layer homology domain-containing protein [Candidatus Peregrinibacteria bacterium]|nr:MAG: S-layer homology domain-containing protein [Candidatus Peregrinibacteria bacterium]
MTDGANGDVLDGIVHVMVGLAQEQVNHFSINATLNSETSATTQVTIQETSAITPQLSGASGDKVAPPKPIVNPIEGPVNARRYTITGTAEAEANINVNNTDGSRVAATRANANGFFEVSVPLEMNQTNRFNITAEDAAYNESIATQVVIQAVQNGRVVSSVVNGKRAVRALRSLAQRRAMNFTDLEGHWAKDYIHALYDIEVINGKTTTRFAPNDNVTRAEILKMALEAFNYDIPGIASNLPYSDVALDAWYAPYIQVGFEEGILRTKEGELKPNQAVNRAEALQIILDAAEVELGTHDNIFTDVPNQSWYTNYVTYANAEGIVQGYGDGTFGPGRDITRAQSAKIIVKVLEMLE